MQVIHLVGDRGEVGVFSAGQPAVGAAHELATFDVRACVSSRRRDRVESTQ